LASFEVLAATAGIGKQEGEGRGERRAGTGADRRDGDVSAAGIACHRAPLGPQGAFVEALRGAVRA